jgi:hypothetical protein
VRRSLDPTPEIRVDGEPVASETLVSIIGAHAVAVSTTISGVPAQLHSTYLGDPAVDTQIAEVRLAPHVGRESLTRSVTALALPVTHEPLRALYDHLQRLQDMLARRGPRYRRQHRPLRSRLHVIRGARAPRARLTGAPVQA